MQWIEYDELAEEYNFNFVRYLIVRLLATPQDLEDLAIGHVACEGRGEN